MDCQKGMSLPPHVATVCRCAMCDAANYGLIAGMPK